MGEETVQSANYLEVVVATALDSEKSFNIDEPKSDITLASVQSAFSTLMEANDSDCVVFGDKNGEAYTTFKRALQVATIKRTKPLV